MPIAHINIGSNIGDRLSSIRQAVAAIESCFHAPAKVSAPFQSPPWGYDSRRLYLNVGLNIEIGNISPHDLLHTLQSIQHSIDPSPHRDASGTYIDRIIDIDLIAIDSITVHSSRLTLPHPRMGQREFVLRPMAEVWPEWIDPITGFTPLQLLDNLRNHP